MRLSYDRRWFWIQNLAFPVLLLGVSGLQILMTGQAWSSLLWMQDKAAWMLPLLALFSLLPVAVPSLLLSLEERRRARGLGVVISPGARAHRAQHWSSPLPWPALVLPGLWCLMVALSWTDALPRICFGYRGALGRGLAVAWRQEASADGRYLALDAQAQDAGGSGMLAILERAGGKTSTYPLPGPVQHLAWSPDGRWLAVGGGSYLQILDMNTQRATPLKRTGLVCLAFHPGGDLWTLAEDGLWAWNPRTRASTRLLDKEAAGMNLDGSPQFPVGMAISPSGARMALRYQRQVRILDGSTMGPIARWEAPREAEGSKELRYAGEDRLILASRPEEGKGAGTDAGVGDVRAQDLHVLDAAQGASVGRIQGVKWDTKSLEHLDVSRDGRWVVALRADRCLAVWSMDSRTWVWSVPEPTATGEKAPRFGLAGEITTAGYSERQGFWSGGGPIRRWRWRR